ncbi:MAG: hypothetical protein RBU36_15240 [Thermoanaerobaculia bacterium]|nr:hypothetical protein [Thermoanaerobaculia bacterium]
MRGGGLEGQTLSRLAGSGLRVPILYGRLWVAPDIVHIEWNTFLPLYRVVISEGPIDAVEEWQSPSRIDTITLSLGSLSPTAGLPSWSIGLACAEIQQDAGATWLPNCLARGRKPYDPRLGAWGAGEYPDSAYCAYSTNPALIMADLATFPQYGWMRTSTAFDPAAVDWASVEDAADWCDELVSGAKRYEIGGLYIQSGDTAEAWSETVGLHAGLRWRSVGGLWRLEYDSGAAAVNATITEDDLPLDSSPRVTFGAGGGLSDQPNRWTAEYMKAIGAGQEVATVTVQTAEVDNGAAPRDAVAYKLHGFNNETMARRALARIRDEILSEVEVSLDLPLDFLHLDVGSRWTAQLPSIGFVGVDFRVTRLAYDADRVRITSQLYAATTWDAATEGELAGPAPVGADDPLQGYLPSPPPPAPSAAPTAPAVVAPPPLGLVPVYRRLADPWATGDGLVWDETDRVVEPGVAGGGGSPLTVKEEDGSPSVANVTELRFSGATVTDNGAGAVTVTVTAGGGATSPASALYLHSTFGGF